MTDCLSLLRSLADAERVLVCAGGPAWRDSFLLGLAALAVVAALVVFALNLARGLGPDPFEEDRRG